MDHELIRLSELNTAENLLIAMQKLLDEARVQHLNNAEFQLALNVRQIEINRQKKRVMAAKSLILDPN